MFTPDERQRIHDHVLAWARRDPQIVSGAVVGSLADSEGDRWSDLDLTFGVREGIPIEQPLAAITEELGRIFGAMVLFDLPSGAALYRVFLMPGCLQVDLSFAPASRWGALGPRFRLLFGEQGTPIQPRPQRAETLFGLAVHHALRARLCIERGRLWRAAYWLGSLRDESLALACLEHGLAASHGRGVDSLPAPLLESARATFPAGVHRGELLRVFGAALDLLSACARGAGESAGPVLQQLGQLAADPLDPRCDTADPGASR